VERDAPADRAGLRSGDVVVRFAGRPVQTHIDLLALAADTAPGTVVPVELVRDGAPLRASVRVAPPDDEVPRRADLGGTDRFGFKLAPDAYGRCLSRGHGADTLRRGGGAARRARRQPGVRAPAHSVVAAIVAQ
jgi:hypothetical protein